MAKTIKFIPIIIGLALLLVGCWKSGVRPLVRGEVQRMVGQVGPTSPHVVPAPAKRTPEAYEQSGDALYLRQEWMGALYQYHKAYALRRKSARLLTKIGLVYLKMGNFRQARDRFRQALKTKPDSAVACQGLGVILVLDHKYAEAEPYLKKAVQLGPRLWRAWNYLGIMYNTSRRLAKAKQCFEQAIKINPNHAGLVNNLGLNLYLSGDLAGAERLFLKAVAMDPKNRRFNNNLALVYARQGKLDRARQAFIAGNGPAVAANNMGVVHLLKGDRGAAADAFARALETKTSYYRKAHQNLKMVGDVTPIQKLTLGGPNPRPAPKRRVSRSPRKKRSRARRPSTVVETRLPRTTGATRGF
ncbi:MAG: tetratricopeptide repeat protein [Proteobacteria bacterium]|nr:tetratricopeptide repeat protein [Pseudomonadota bacterium]MBU1740175.1 tetratricopeptide repeat protein [Pseudomonadota bacterium]